jgi:hypothetical protein
VTVQVILISSTPWSSCPLFQVHLVIDRFLTSVDGMLVGGLSFWHTPRKVGEDGLLSGRGFAICS